MAEETEDSDSKTNNDNSDIVNLKLQLKEEKENRVKLASELRETKKSLKKSESRCDELVNQVENWTIAKTKAVAETTRMRTLADSLQVLIDSKKEAVKRTDEDPKEIHKDKPDDTKKRTNRCKYWNKIYCFKGDECSWSQPEEDCQEHLQQRKCYNRNCSKRHIRVCRYIANQIQGCHRGAKCK